MGMRKPTAWSVSLVQPRKETSSRRVHPRSSRSASVGSGAHPSTRRQRSEVSGARAASAASPSRG